MIVYKFGGTSLADAKRIRHAADLVRECEGRRVVVVSALAGVTDRLADTAANAFMNILTILLGICVGCFMSADTFLRVDSLIVFGLGVIAFASSTAFGVGLAKFMNLFTKEKINPMIGAAGVSAVPMAARVVQKMGQQANPRNFLLMHAMGPNIAGVIGTATAAGIFLGMVG